MRYRLTGGTGPLIFKAFGVLVSQESLTYYQNFVCSGGTVLDLFPKNWHSGGNYLLKLKHMHNWFHNSWCFFSDRRTKTNTYCIFPLH